MSTKNKEEKRLKDILLRIDEQTAILKNVNSQVNLATDSRSLLWRQIDSIKKRIRALKFQLKNWGIGTPISIVKFGYIPTNGFKDKVITNVIFYPTHDDEELKFLIARDFGDEQPLSIIKQLTGIKAINSK